MGFYGERVYPRLINLAMNTKETRRVRSEVCAPLSGEVLEIGFGTGLNLPHLPSTVTRLRAVDPMQKGQELAAERLAATSIPVDFIGLDGQSIPLDDDSVDAVLCTWTVCTIPDPVAAISEARRVLKPGGTFHFVEHGLSPDAKVRTWQDRVNGFNRRVACGCNVNRDIPAIIQQGGFTLGDVDTYYAKGEPKTIGWTFKGIAHAAS